MTWKRAVCLGIMVSCGAAMLLADVGDRRSQSSDEQLQAAAPANSPVVNDARAGGTYERATPCENSVWDNGYSATIATTRSSQYDDQDPNDIWSPQSADDFMLTFDVGVEDVHWVGRYWNNSTDPNFPDHEPTGFRVIFYAQDPAACRPTGHGLTDPAVTALAIYNFTMAQVNQVAQGTGYYDYSAVLDPPFPVTANTKYWLVIQQKLWYPPQWGWSAHTVAPVPLCPVVRGFLPDTPFWTQPTGAAQAHNFCLTVGSTPTGACCWDEGQTPPSAPYCQDGYLDFFCTQQGGRFSMFHQCAAGGPLPQIDPVCGNATGACCKPDGMCTLVKASQCPLATGLWLGYLTTCEMCPCIFDPNDCPPDAIVESEACGSHTDDGCSSDSAPYLFADIQCDKAVCGTIYADASQSPTRDVDWWRLVLTEPKTVTFALKSEFPMFMGFAIFNPQGSADCANYGGYVGPYQAEDDNDINCNGLTIQKRCDAGTHYIMIQSWVADGYPCMPGTYNSYIGTLTCTEAASTCPPDTVYNNYPGYPLWEWDNGPSSQLTSGWHSQTADDFTLSGTGTQHVGDVHWAGTFWNPGVGSPTAFNIYFYNDASGMPTRDPDDPPAGDPAVSAIAAYNVLIANVAQYPIYVGHGGGQFAYAANLAPPVSLAAGTKYWIGIQAVMSFPPQWGWLAHNTPITGSPAVQGFPSLAMDYWTAQTYDQNFCLTPGGPAHPCALNGDMDGNGVVDNFDINKFVYALSHTAAQFAAQYPAPANYWCADGDCNNTVDNFDINKFVKCLTGDPSCINCP